MTTFDLTDFIKFFFLSLNSLGKLFGVFMVVFNIVNTIILKSLFSFEKFLYFLEIKLNFFPKPLLS